MHSHRLLIVEDHESTRYILQSILKRRGWDVIAVGTVAEGLASLDPPPACLVLDLDLPDGRGETVLQRVRENHMPTKVAVCTGMYDPARWDAVKRLRPEALLQKPIEVDSVCTACGPDMPLSQARATSLK